MLSAELVVPVLRVFYGPLQAAHILKGLPRPTRRQLVQPAISLHASARALLLVTHCHVVREAGARGVFPVTPV